MCGQLVQTVLAQQFALVEVLYLRFVAPAVLDDRLLFALGGEVGLHAEYLGSQLILAV